MKHLVSESLLNYTTGLFGSLIWKMDFLTVNAHQTLAFPIFLFVSFMEKIQGFENKESIFILFMLWVYLLHEKGLRIW